METLKRTPELVKKLAKVKGVASDIDGTITINREGYLIPFEAVEGIRLLKKFSIPLFFISANAFPVVFALARYLGANGFVAENGCMVATLSPERRDLNLVELCNKGEREIAKKLSEVFSDYVREAWQNDYRKYDFALVLKNSETNPQTVFNMIKEYIEKNGLSDRVTVKYSGYAFHITPIGANKLNGLKKLLDMTGIDIKDIAGIGDSAMDLEFIKETGIKVAVANADEELKRAADIVTDYESGYGFAQLCRTIVELKKIRL